MERRLQYRLGWLLGWVALCGVAFLYFASRSIHSDEGNVLNMAWQLMYGKQMYTDFVEFVAPGSGYITFWFWQLLGDTSFRAARMLSIGMWSLSAAALGVLTWKHTKSVLPVLLVALGWMIATEQHPLINYNAHSSFIAIGAIALYWFARTRGGRWYAIAGAGFGIVALFLQTKGMLLLGAVMLCHLLFVKAGNTLKIDTLQRVPVKQRITEAVLLLMGGVGSMLIASAFWVNPLILLESLFVLPFQLSYLNHSVYEIPPAVTQIIVVLLEMIAVLLIARYRLIKEQSTLQFLWLLIAVQAALFVSSVNLIDWAHFGINLFPTVAFVGIVVHALLVRLFSKRSVVVIVVEGLIAVGMLATIGAGISQVFSGTHIYMSEQEQREHIFSELFTSTEITQAEDIYAGPFLPGFYYEFGKENLFTGASNMTLCDEACETEAIAILQQNEIEFVFLDYIISHKFGYDPQRRFDTLIREEYELCGVIHNRLQVLRKGSCEDFSL